MRLITAIAWLLATFHGVHGNDVVIGILGNSVSIDCKLPVTDMLVWQSLTDGVIAMGGEVSTTNSTKYTVDRYDGERESLMIRDVTLTDETEYRCFDLHDKARVHVTVLHVLVRPAYLNVTYPTKPVLEGTVVMLMCESGGGKPLPEITWSSRGLDGTIRALKGIQSHTLYTNGTGHVTNVLQLNVTRDAFMRTFLCSASVPVFYTETKEVNLDVHFPPHAPVITGYPGSFGEDTNIRFECTSTGSHPTATVFWEINGSRVSDTEFVVIPGANHTSTVRSFLTRRMSRDLDGSVLTCAATNSVVNTRGLEPVATAITLRMSYKPKLTTLTERYVVKEGSNVTMKCLIDALPATNLTSVQWTHNSAVVNQEGYELSENATQLYLHLSNISRTDAGNYTCNVSNRLGPATSQMKLSVLHAPQCVTDQTQRLPVSIGSTVRLECQMYAFPVAVTFFWRNRVTQNIITSTTATRDSSKDGLVNGGIDVTIASRDQYMDIECVGTNTEIGEIQPCLYRIEPPGPAEAPTKCKVISTDSQVSVTCQAGFHGGSTQTFLLQKQVRTSYETITKSSIPKFAFVSSTNTTIRVCAVNENFRNMIQCSNPIAVVVYNSATHYDDTISAKGDNSVDFLAGGIAAFVGLLIVITVLILLARKRHKNVSRRTSPTVEEALGKRRKAISRLAVGSKWWYTVKPSVSHASTPDRNTPAMSRSTRDGPHVICSTPYYDNKQPVLNVVGNSPIFPANVQGSITASHDRYGTNKGDSMGESTGFIVGSITYQDDSRSSYENMACKYMETGTYQDVRHIGSVDYQNVGDTVHKKGSQISICGMDDSKSVDICAITLEVDYSAGDIADVLDNTKHDRMDTTFDLDKPTSHIVVDGTTLSFDPDFSATLSNVSTCEGNSSTELQSGNRDDVSFVSNILSRSDDLLQDKMMLTVVSNQLFDKKIMNTTYTTHNTRDNPHRSKPTLNEIDNDCDTTLCPDIIPFSTPTSRSSCINKVKPETKECVKGQAMTPFLTYGSELSGGSETLNDLDKCSVARKNNRKESHLDKSTAKYDTFVVTESHVSDGNDNGSSESEHYDLRNNSFRIAIDNSTLDNAVIDTLDTPNERNRLTMYLMNENYMSEDTIDDDLSESSDGNSYDISAFYDTKTLEETVAYV